MCGRTGLSLNKETLQCACSFMAKGSNSYQKPEWTDEHNDGKTYTPSYNIAPTDITPVLISGSRFKTGGTNAHIRLLKPMMWGMIPPWHTGDYKNHNLSTNNCRLENIQNSKLYGPALRNGGRCIIVVEGFYEWQTTKTAKSKQPYYIFAPQEDNIKMDDPDTWNNIHNEETGWKGMKLLHLAGVYSMWKNNDTIMYAYSIITMDSNTTLDWLHHRMPAILDTGEQINAWLDIDNVSPNTALSYLKPVKMLSWYPVSTAVNNSKNKSVECNKRISLESKEKSSQKSITTWFTKTVKRKSNDETVSDAKKPKKGS